MPVDYFVTFERIGGLLWNRIYRGDGEELIETKVGGVHFDEEISTVLPIMPLL